MLQCQIRSKHYSNYSADIFYDKKAMYCSSRVMCAHLKMLGLSLPKLSLYLSPIQQRTRQRLETLAVSPGDRDAWNNVLQDCIRHLYECVHVGVSAEKNVQGFNLEFESCLNNL